jgi:pimeloyl-ACP methyl ester carboxylesterase
MVKQEEISLYGLSIHIKITGEGNRTILFIHGAGASSESWAAQLQNKSLNENYRLIAFDLPGHGQSEWISDDSSKYRADQMALLIKGVLDKYKIVDYILVALSFGTSIVAEIKQPLPGCVGIVLASPFIVNETVTAGDILIPGPFAHVMVAVDPSEEDLSAYISGIIENKQLAKKYIKDYRNTDPAFRAELGRAAMETQVSDQLQNIRNWNVPVCIVFGKNDSLLKKDYLNDYPAVWKRKVIMIEGAGHALNEEQPEVFSALLLDFATEVFK